MTRTTFEGQRLQASFTFRIVEAVRRIKVHPMPRAAGLPWGLSLATGIIITVMSLNPHIALQNPTSMPAGSLLSNQAKVLKTGEIPVDILNTSQIPAIFSNKGSGDGGSLAPSVQQRAFFLAPSAEDDTWTRKADMPTARHGLSTSVVNGRIYAIGGYTLDTFGGDASTVEEYDPVADTWKKKADMLAPNAEFSTSVVNGKIYAIGGLTPWATGFSRVEEYDPATDTWRKRADMPTPRWGLSTSVVNGKIYAIGGTDVWIGTTSQGLQTVEEYDPATDTWRKRADMPTARYWFSASVVDGKIYAIGGWDGTMVHSMVEEYDPVTDTWTRKAGMPTPRWALSTSVVNRKIYAIGGSEPLSIVEKYDPATDTWTRKADMPTPRFWFTTSAVNGKIYAIGGKQSRAPADPSLSIVEEYDTGFVLEEKGKSVSAKGKLPATWGKVK